MDNILWADSPITLNRPAQGNVTSNAGQDMVFHQLIPSQLEQTAAAQRLAEALSDCDDGELFLEFCQTERIVFGEGKIKSCSNSMRRGMGLRAVDGESTFFGHTGTLGSTALDDLCSNLRPVRKMTDEGLAQHERQRHTGKRIGDFPPLVNSAKNIADTTLYSAESPLNHGEMVSLVALMHTIDASARQNPHVQDVTITLQGEWQVISGMRPHQPTYHDVRPRCELSIQVIMQSGDKRSSGSHAVGGRTDYDTLLADWATVLSFAVQQGEIMLQAVAAPAGAMDIVLGSGWPGILLHEAIGHGLEADFNRKQTSVFSQLMGRRIADQAVTVVDQGNISGRRGSLHIDDEGTPTQSTTLIQEGILCGYMQDRLNARLMKKTPTGNGRRQSYQHLPMPRMTNTFMTAGNIRRQDLIAEVKNGIFATSFGGGSVDITSGQFVFNCTEAYRIENGRITHPIKGVSIIGMGAEALKGIRGIGDDLALDSGMGMCGKEGQWVPVGVGQPSLLIGGLRIGGSGS